MLVFAPPLTIPKPQLDGFEVLAPDLFLKIEQVLLPNQQPQEIARYIIRSTSIPVMRELFFSLKARTQYLGSLEEWAGSPHVQAYNMGFFLLDFGYLREHKDVMNIGNTLLYLNSLEGQLHDLTPKIFTKAASVPAGGAIAMVHLDSIWGRLGIAFDQPANAFCYKAGIYRNPVRSFRRRSDAQIWLNQQITNQSPTIPYES